MAIRLLRGDPITPNSGSPVNAYYCELFASPGQIAFVVPERLPEHLGPGQELFVNIRTLFRSGRIIDTSIPFKAKGGYRRNNPLAGYSHEIHDVTFLELWRRHRERVDEFLLINPNDILVAADSLESYFALARRGWQISDEAPRKAFVAAVLSYIFIAAIIVAVDWPTFDRLLVKMQVAVALISMRLVARPLTSSAPRWMPRACEPVRDAELTSV